MRSLMGRRTTSRCVSHCLVVLGACKCKQDGRAERQGGRHTTAALYLHSVRRLRAGLVDDATHSILNVVVIIIIFVVVVVFVVAGAVWRRVRSTAHPSHGSRARLGAPLLRASALSAWQLRGIRWCGG